MVFRYTINCALLAILLACTFRSYGQNLENAHWHFGQEIGLFHTSTSLELTSSSINTLNGVTPASISNSSGQLQLYTNGTDVHNASHEIIENGSFSNTGLMNVFVPMPGNPDQYYIFRSAEWGVDYSIIDLTLNGGNGGIIEDQKEIEINAYKSELMVSGNPLTENLWLIIADNQAGNTDNINFRSFEVSSSAVTLMETSSFNYLWAGFFSDLDNARLSPDCSKIAVLHKGHFLTLFQFDNETGIVSNGLSNAVNTYSSFTQRCNLEFSPSSEYIYVISDFDQIDRFHLETWTPMAITLSQTTIAAAPTSVQTWRDIKVSIYDEIYLYNIQTNTIDRIIDPDVTGLGTGVESGNLVIESTQGYFPRTPNLSCSSFAIQVDNHCLGDTTHLNFSISLEPDEVLWDFGSGSATTGSASENPTWIVFNAPGNYDLNLNVMLDGVWHDYPITVSIGEKPNVELGENVVLCQGETVNFSVPGEENYEVLWSTGETTPAITVESAGVYSVDVDNVGCIVSDTVEVEMIPMIESNLEDVVLCTDTVEVELNAGNQAANEYNWNTGETSPSIEVENPGQYWVTLSNSCFTVVDSAEVLMIVFPEILLPADTILCAGQNLEVSVNYSEGNISWSTGATGPGIVISQAGNYEVVIDHLGCIAVDEIEADYIQEVSVNLPDYVLCEQEEVDFDVTHPAAEFYLWSTGSTDPEISVSEGGQLWVEVANQCFTDLDTAMVQQIIFPDPLLPGHINACYGDTVQLLSAFSEGIFNWSGGETTNHIQVTESGTYLLTIDYLGCPATAITDVEFQDYFPLNELKVPNVFTPNADDANQHFRPYIPEFPDRWLCNDVWLEAEVTIYNRWGNELHKSICAWDGKSANGQSMHEGTYYYLVDLKANCYNRKESRQIAGYVSLLR